MKYKFLTKIMSCPLHYSQAHRIRVVVCFVVKATAAARTLLYNFTTKYQALIDH